MTKTRDAITSYCSTVLRKRLPHWMALEHLSVKHYINATKDRYKMNLDKRMQAITTFMARQFINVDRPLFALFTAALKVEKAYSNFPPCKPVICRGIEAESIIFPIHLQCIINVMLADSMSHASWPDWKETRLISQCLKKNQDWIPCSSIRKTFPEQYESR